MTWQNLPCAPTLAAISAACPLGWIEVVFEFHAGNASTDPPQDADCTRRLGRVWGVDGSDLGDLMDQHGEVLADLAEPPLGVPSTDFALLLRMEHVASPCNTCGRSRELGETRWLCFTPDDEDAAWPDEACTGSFPLALTLRVGWGVDGRPVLSTIPEPRYTAP